jgi:hypothetical protein
MLIIICISVMRKCLSVHEQMQFASKAINSHDVQCKGKVAASVTNGHVY